MTRAWGKRFGDRAGILERTSNTGVVLRVLRAEAALVTVGHFIERGTRVNQLPMGSQVVINRGGGAEAKMIALNRANIILVRELCVCCLLSLVGILGFFLQME